MSKQITGVEASRLFHAASERSANAQPAVFSLKKARISRICGDTQKDLVEALKATPGFEAYMQKRVELIGEKQNSNYVFLIGGFYPFPGFANLSSDEAEKIGALDTENKGILDKAEELGKLVFDLDLPKLTPDDFKGVTLTQEAAAAFELLTVLE